MSRVYTFDKFMEVSKRNTLLVPFVIIENVMA